MLDSWRHTGSMRSRPPPAPQPQYFIQHDLHRAFITYTTCSAPLSQDSLCSPFGLPPVQILAMGEGEGAAVIQIEVTRRSAIVVQSHHQCQGVISLTVGVAVEISKALMQESDVEEKARNMIELKKCTSAMQGVPERMGV